MKAINSPLVDGPQGRGYSKLLRLTDYLPSLWLWRSKQAGGYRARPASNSDTTGYSRTRA